MQSPGGELDAPRRRSRAARGPAGTGWPPRRGARAARLADEWPGSSSQTAISNAPSSDGESSSKRNAPSSRDDRCARAAPHDAGHACPPRRAGGTAPCRARRRCCAACRATGRAAPRSTWLSIETRDAGARGQVRRASGPRAWRRRRIAAPSWRRCDLADTSGAALDFSLTKTDASIAPCRAASARTALEPLARVTDVLVTGAAGGLGARARGGAASRAATASWRSTASPSRPRRRARATRSTLARRGRRRGARWPTRPRRGVGDPPRRRDRRRRAARREGLRRPGRAAARRVPRARSSRTSSRPGSRCAPRCPHLRRADGDRSITLTSSTDALASYGLPAYAAAKAGLIGLVRSLAATLGADGHPHQRGRARRRADAAQRARVGARARLVRPAARGAPARPARRRPRTSRAAYLALIDLRHVTGQMHRRRRRPDDRRGPTRGAGAGAARRRSR